MNPQSNNFPLFFTLERVDNGYILAAKEETGSLTQEAEFRKEVVTEDKVHARQSVRTLTRPRKTFRWKA